MNYKQAAGRNWNRTTRRQAAVHLDRPQQAAAPPNLPTWLDRRGDALRQAPGRNWVRDRRPPRPVHLEHDPEALATLTSAPAREFGGGDHDQPYRYSAPSARWSFPFSTRQYARLLAFRSRLALQAERQPGHQHDDFVGGRREQLIGQA
jgi:hypothetical protein